MSVATLLTNVLFVGHSLVGPDLPPMVEGALLAMGVQATVEAQVINGAPLRYQWDNGATAEGVDARARLAKGDVDVLVLTEAIPLAAQVEWNASADFVARWAGAAWAANPQTQVLVYETWHSLDSGPGGPVPDDPGGQVPWADRLAADRAVWQGLADAANAVRPAGAPPVRVVPAGQAMGRLAVAARAGEVPGMADIRDAFDDDIHLSGRGMYLVALVHAAMIAGKPPDGLPARLGRLFRDRRSAISPEMALAMQRIASEAIAADVAAGAPSAVPAASLPTAPPATEPPAPQPLAEVRAATPADAVAQPDPIIAALGGITVPGVALNLSGVHDWSTQVPFLNLMKTARPWIAHRPGQWGGWEISDLRAGGHVDAGNWPRRMPPGAEGMATLVLTDLPPETGGVAGRYDLTWSGGGDFRVEGRADALQLAPNRISFDFTPGPGGVIITLTGINPADPPRDIALVRQDRAAALAAGHIFNPDFLARLRGVEVLRFMDWGATNGSTLIRAADRPRPDDFTWAFRGVPVEVMAALANELDAEAWFCVPHMADDALATDMARAAAQTLHPGRRAWVEYSNEVWNWSFPQAQWADEQAGARWTEKGQWMQFYGLRAAEVADLWSQVFADPARLVRVVSSQTGWLGLEDQALNAPLAVAEGRKPPKTSFDAYAVTGYFAASLGTESKLPLLRGWLDESLRAAEAAADAQGLTGAARTDHIAAHRFDLAMDGAARELADGAVSGNPEDTLAALRDTIWPYHAAVAKAAGLQLVMYEGGTHVMGLGPLGDDPLLTEFYTRLNYAPQMGDLYVRLRQDWAEVSAAPFAAFNDIESPSRWGSWGLLRHLADDNPRWRALARGCPAC